jgi:hypothetical protein
MPDAGLARRRRLLRWLVIGVAAAVVAAAVLFVVRPRPRLESEPAPTGEAAADPKPALAPETASPAAVVPVPVPATATASGPPGAPTGIPRSSTEASARKPEKAVEPERAAEVRPPPSPPRSRPIADGESFAGAVALPDGERIELGGIVYSETDPRALLNDRILGVGAYVNGFTVGAIAPDRVALEKDGLTIYLVLK